jgi:DHA2 family multidrug resistance protein
MWNDRTDYHHGVLIEHVAADSAPAVAYQAQLATQGLPEALNFAYIERIIGIQASTLGANDVFYMLCLLYIVMIPFLWLARPPFGAAGAANPGH